MSLLQFSLTMLVAQFSPGPDMLLLLKSAVNHPLRAGLITIWGICCGLAVHCCAAAFGLGSLLKLYPRVFQIMLIAGALYLTWLGMKLLRSVFQESKDEHLVTRVEQPLSDGDAFRVGLLTNLSNAKAFLFLTSLLATALLDDASGGRKAVLIGIILGQALVFWSLFLWLLKRPRIAALYLSSQRPINALLGLLLLLAAVQIAFESVRQNHLVRQPPGLGKNLAVSLIKKNQHRPTTDFTIPINLAGHFGQWRLCNLKNFKTGGTGDWQQH